MDSTWGLLNQQNCYCMIMLESHEEFLGKIGTTRSTLRVLSRHDVIRPLGSERAIGCSINP